MAQPGSTAITFLATGDPTGLKFTVESGGWRALFDFGTQHAPGAWPFAQGLHPRPGRELADFRALGLAPSLDGIYSDQPWDGRTALFLSHLHLDHTGLVRFLSADLPLLYPAAMEPVRQGAGAGGEVLWRSGPAGRLLTDRERVEWGPIRVQAVAVDHDVPGATGYLISTPGLAVAYTGDHRWHGLHPERTEAFAEAARGVDVLIQEAVSASSLPPLGGVPAAAPALAVASEADVLTGFDDVVRTAPGLVLLNAYPMNRERVAAFAGAAQDAGRRLVLEEGFAATAGLPAQAALQEAASDPRGHVVQVSFERLPTLLDLDLRRAWYVHSDGMPLGSFDPAFGVLEAWIGKLGLHVVALRSSGHSRAEDLSRIAEVARPGLVLPVHSRAPERFRSPTGTGMLVPEAGRRYLATDLRRAASVARP